MGECNAERQFLQGGREGRERVVVLLCEVEDGEGGWERREGTVEEGLREHQMREGRRE